MNARRGYVPDDDRNFSPEAVLVMKTASKHIRYLINEGYDLKSASTFVGNHFLLSERQRLAIVRSLATDEELCSRNKKRWNITDMSGQTVWIDGFNEIITLEVMFSHSPLFLGTDGCIRDLAALRGTYRIIPETDMAIRLMLGVLSNAGVRKAVILLDEPISNSGRLKAKIADIREEGGNQFSLELDIQILRNVDKELYDKEFVITSDSVILDNCSSWINLTEKCVKQTGAELLQVW